MKEIITGKIWKFGDNIDTDIIIPARYLPLPIAEMKFKAMEPLRPDFPEIFAKGGIIAAGKNFGCGSSREQAPAVLKELGVSAIIAESFARIFFRNSVNLGIPLIECAGISQEAEEGDRAEINPSEGTVKIPGKNLCLPGTRLPDFLLEIIKDGGLINHLVINR